MFYIFIYYNANLCVLLFFSEKYLKKYVVLIGYNLSNGNIFGINCYFPRKKHAVISFFFSMFIITKDMNSHMVKSKIIRTSSLCWKRL